MQASKCMAQMQKKHRMFLLVSCAQVEATSYTVCRLCDIGSFEVMHFNIKHSILAHWGA